MRLPNAAHEAHPWLVEQVTHDFRLLDVWALPVRGERRDFRTLVAGMGSLDPAEADSLMARVLWRVREVLGTWLGLDRKPSSPAAERDRTEEGQIPGTNVTSLAERLPHGLRDTASDVAFGSGPFVPLYCTDVEFAAEISNQTVHGVIHLGWVDEGRGCYTGQMAIYVKPRGLLGNAYMALITPFRHWIIYPALMRQIEREWNARTSQGSSCDDFPSRSRS